MTPKELDELEQLAKEMVAAKGSSVHTGLYMAYWRAADPQTVLTLIAAARERDALLGILGQWREAYDAFSVEDAATTIDFDNACDTVLLALAQHRGEAGGSDET
jgi:hypothetical protein